jgi:hypothetical protein
MRRFPSLLGLMLVVALSACGGPPERDLGLRAPLDCVPFARALSGIHLRGDAADWWWRDGGRYARGRAPEVGSVMVFAQTSRLPRGHISVVSRVMSRELGASSRDGRPTGAGRFTIWGLVRGPCMVAGVRCPGQHELSGAWVYLLRICHRSRSNRSYRAERRASGTERMRWPLCSPVHLRQDISHRPA